MLICSICVFCRLHCNFGYIYASLGPKKSNFLHKNFKNVANFSKLLKNEGKIFRPYTSHMARCFLLLKLSTILSRSKFSSTRVFSFLCVTDVFKLVHESDIQTIPSGTQWCYSDALPSHHCSTTAPTAHMHYNQVQQVKGTIITEYSCTLYVGCSQWVLNFVLTAKTSFL